MSEKSYKDMSIEELETSDYLRGDVTFMDKVYIVLGIAAGCFIVTLLVKALFNEF